jgi:solute carrier family 8 (sodium/calcium exchanger)
VIIEADKEAKNHVDRVMAMARAKMAKAEVGHKNWIGQFKDAVFVNGGDEEEEEDGEEDGEEKGGDEATLMDWVMHIITIFWKVLFAFIPPVDYCGGWLCFVCALAMIGIVTAVIGDLASLLGCVWGIPDGVTAVTFVALGTSLPDTFASKTAAQQDPYADASIGNITGSNSVNVFLGIGMPWLMGAIFWSMQGEDDDSSRYAKWIGKYNDLGSVVEDYPKGNVFVVKAGSLASSVAVFAALGVITLATLVIRRKLPMIGGELGGPNGTKYATSLFFVCLWFTFLSFYITMTVSELDKCDK